LEIGSAYTLIFLVMALPLLLGMQWFTPDAAQARARRKAKRLAKKQLKLSGNASVKTRYDATPGNAINTVNTQTVDADAATNTLTLNTVSNEPAALPMTRSQENAS
jgi:hypothetical protein